MHTSVYGLTIPKTQKADYDITIQSNPTRVRYSRLALLLSRTAIVF